MDLVDFLEEKESIHKLKKIEKKLGPEIKRAKFIGSGVNGSAFRLKNKVLKITSFEAEYTTALKVMKYKGELKRISKPIDCFKIQGIGYGILSPFYKKLSWDKVEMFVDTIGGEINSWNKKMLNYFFGYGLEYLNELRQVGIMNCDVHDGNVMMAPDGGPMVIDLLEA